MIVNALVEYIFIINTIKIKFSTWLKKDKITNFMKMSMPNKSKPSRTIQTYAAEIFRLEQDSDQVSLSALAHALDSSHQAISRMIQKMEKSGYCEFEAYRGVRLTELGRKTAMPSLRRHRLGEVFLVNVMGYDWAEAHILADQFENGLNQDLENRIDELTGHPAHCPHGEPIPNKQGEIVFPNDKPLVESETNLNYRLSRVRTHDTDKLRYLHELQLKPGLEFMYVSKAPFRGPVRMRFPEGDKILGFELASSFWVEAI
jgi:DtxR family Mn-dependent transcriptional regulator